MRTISVRIAKIRIFDANATGLVEFSDFAFETIQTFNAGTWVIFH